MTGKAVETFIGVNEVFGGVLILAAQASAVRHGLVALPTLYTYLAIGAAGISVWAGWLLIRRERLGHQLSVVLQALQIFGVASQTFSWRFELGLKVTVDWTSSAVMTHWGSGGLYGIQPWTGAPELTFILNPLALIAMLYLVRRSRQASSGQMSAGPQAAGAAQLRPTRRGGQNRFRLWHRASGRWATPPGL